MYHDAEKKLNVEMDILEIIKINRILRLFLTVNTSPKQREIVKFFDEYTLHASDDPKDGSDSDEGLVFEDVKKDSTVGNSDLLVS